MTEVYTALGLASSFKSPPEDDAPPYDWRNPCSLLLLLQRTYSASCYVGSIAGGGDSGTLQGAEVMSLALPGPEKTK